MWPQADITEEGVENQLFMFLRTEVERSKISLSDFYGRVERSKASLSDFYARVERSKTSLSDFYVMKIDLSAYSIIVYDVRLSETTHRY